MGLDTVELIMHVERAFGIDVPNAEVGALGTVGDLHACVLRHKPDADPSAAWARLVGIFVEEYAIPAERIRPEASIVRDLGLD